MPPKKVPATKPATKQVTKKEVKSPASKSNAKPKATAEQPKKDDQAAAQVSPAPIEVMTISMKQIPAVILKDEDGKIKASGKCALVIDESERAVVFLRYQNCNMINTLDPANMVPNSIRLAILGAIRYGKHAILDIQDTDIFGEVQSRMDGVLPGLLDLLLNQEILKDETYMKLISKDDSSEYQDKYSYGLAEEFRFVILTKVPAPDDKLMKRTYPIKIES